MDFNETIYRIKGIIIRIMELSIDPNSIQGDDLINELGINSIDAMEILVTVEGEFGIEIDDEDLNSDLIQSLRKLAEYTIRKCSS